MRLFWLVYEVEGKRCVWIEEAPDIVTAKVKASRAVGKVHELAEWHELDHKRARKVPKDALRKLLSKARAGRLLKQLSAA
jgi:hypothetical protein